MNQFIHGLRSFVQGDWAERVGWTLLHSLWQITLIAAIYLVVLFLLRRRSALSRYVAGYIALLAMLVGPAISYCLLSQQSVRLAQAIETEEIDGPSRGETVALPAEVEILAPILDSHSLEPEPLGFEAASNSPAKSSSDVSVRARVSSVIRPWLPLITTFWLAGVLLLSLRPVAGCFRVRQLRRFGLSPLPDSVREACDKLVQRMGVRGAIRFCQSSLVRSPAVIGYLRPMVLLPVSTVTGLTPSELELILAHELAHIRRHDYILNLAQTLIEALLFYHPGMWWVSSQVRRERENCCDDIALAISGDRATYIRALAQLEEHRIAAPALAATGGSLLSRVRRIVGEPESEFVYRKSILWLTALIVVSITFTAITLAGTAPDQPDEAKGSSEIAEDDGDEEAEVPSALNFDKSVGQKVAQVVRNAKLPFVSERQITEIESDFTSFMNSGIPFGTWSVGSSIPEDQRQAILAAIESHGAKHLRIDQFQQDNLRSINLAYLGLPDRLLTLKWKLYRAIVNARKLDKDKHAKLESQRSWMKQYAESLPLDKGYTHEMALSELEERFADSLACTLGYPMTDEQFDNFRQALQKYSPKGELVHVVSHIVQQSLDAQYRDFTDFELPFNDRVVRYGAGRVVYLGLERHRLFESSLRSVSDIEESGTVIDATTGNLITAPEGSRDGGAFQRWLSKKGRGDFGFDDAQGGGLFCVRGAKMVKLDVQTWHEADAISSEELRVLLSGPSAGRTTSLSQHFKDYRQDKGAPCYYVGVLTKEGRLAVVAVEDFSGRSSIGVRTRVRAEVPEMGTDTPPENSGASQGRTALERTEESVEMSSREANGDTAKMRDPIWGLEVDGIQSSLSFGSAPWIEGEPSPLFHVAARYRGGARKLSSSMDNFVIEIDDNRFSLSSIATGSISRTDFQPPGNNGYVSHDFFFRFTKNNNGTVIHQCQPDGSHIRTLAMLGRKKTNIRFGSSNSSLKPDVTAGEHQLRVGLPAHETNLSNDTNASGDLVYAFSPAIKTTIKSDRATAALSDTNSGRTIKVPKWPRIPVLDQPHAFAGFGTFYIRDDDQSMGRSIISWDEIKPVEGQLHIPPGKALGIGIDSGNYTDLSALQAFAPNRLQSLSLPLQNKIDNRAMPNLAQLTGLKRLLLGGAAITDEGLPHLAKLKNLKYLSLQNCSVTDQSIDTLAQLTSLQEINLWRTWISKQGAKTLQLALPNCRVQWLEATDTDHPSLDQSGDPMATNVQGSLKTKQGAANLIPPFPTTAKLRWDRLKPSNEHARVLRQWETISYEVARANGIKKVQKLPEPWEPVPAGSKSYEVRREVRAAIITFDTTIYERPDLKQFWVQRDPPESSSQTFFGPFDGDPYVVLGIRRKPPNQESVRNKDAVIWGPVNDGLRVGIELPNDGTMANWRPGSKVSCRLWIRNVSQQPKPVTNEVPLFGWYPELHDADGNRVALLIPPYSRPVKFRERNLAVDETAELGQIEFDLPESMKPGRYTLKQSKGVISGSKDLLPIEVSLKIDNGAPADARAEHKQRSIAENDRVLVRKASIKGLSSRLLRVSPQGPIRIGDVLHYDVVLKNDTVQPIEFDWHTGSMWQPVVDEQTRTIMLMGMFAGSGRVNQQHVVVPPKREKTVHTIRYRVVSKDFDDASLPLPLRVTAGDYQIVATGAWGSTPRYEIDIRPQSRLQFRKSKLPEAKALEREVDRVTWVDPDGKQETITLDREIFLDIDDVKIIWQPVNAMQPKLSFHLTDGGTERLRSITNPAVGKGQRLVILLDGEVVAAPTIDKVLANRVLIEKVKPTHTKRINAYMSEVMDYRGKGSTGSSSIGDDTSTQSASVLIISKQRGGQLSPGGIGYSLDGELVTVDQLQDRLKKKREGNPTQRKLLIRADPDLPYQHISVAIQLAKASGVTEFSFATDKEQEPTTKLEVSDVQSYKDGGTTSFKLHRPGQNPIRVCFDFRDRPPVEKPSWKVAGNLTLGRLFTGADYPDEPGAKLVKRGSEEEQRLLSDLNACLDQQLTKELQSRMLTEHTSAESLKRLAEVMGKSVDEIRNIGSLLRKTRQYELVFIQSNGVYVNLEMQFEPQANPSGIPPLLISAVNHGDNEKLILGRTGRSFELEVDGKWYRHGRTRYRSSPLPPGRIYEPFPLTLDEGWLHDGSPLQLSPGKHTIRVRCSVHPFPSNKDTSLATSLPMTVMIKPKPSEAKETGVSESKENARSKSTKANSAS